MEGQSQRNENVAPLIEVRMDGPWIKPLESGRIYAEFEANILIQVDILSNLYLTDEIGGELIAVLFNSIAINDANAVFLGCAQPLIDHRKRIEFNKFGIIDPQSELLQSTVEIRFHVTLEI